MENEFAELASYLSKEYNKLKPFILTAYPSKENILEAARKAKVDISKCRDVLKQMK